MEEDWKISSESLRKIEEEDDVWFIQIDFIYNAVRRQFPLLETRIHMKLYELPRATIQNVAECLRAIADEIESGAYGEIHGTALVLEDADGGIRTFGAGHADYYRAMALFNLGIENLLAKRGRDNML